MLPDENATNAYKFYEFEELKVYYSRSPDYYNTRLEYKDVEFIESLNIKLLNRYNLKYQSMDSFLNDVQNSDIVFFRGCDVKVAIESLFAVSNKKIVVSLKSLNPASEADISCFSDILKSNEFFEYYISLINVNFPDVYQDFKRIIGGKNE